MAKVSLRLYNREIEGKIEAGQLDEAIAHCQYILKNFPMHVETYLLLGKAFLEARRYTDASDIFERALMSIPDNFVSHVGMSIIRDDEGKLNEAIWHMERAFEVQPSNPAIQGELRRLYGRRDGVEPPKIRMSRDALANMYAQGELYNQAIAEIRAVLADDNNRPDLQVMLARAYYYSGQKVEAAGMASNLLKKYTYCMDALRILVDVLPGTTRSEDTQVYRQRLAMLDPYSSFVTGSAFGSDKVADSAVDLERLDYKPGAPYVASQPGWASSLGIQLADDKTAETTPGLMAAAVSSEPTPAVVKEVSPTTSTPAADDQSVPDWMRSAGWQASAGAKQAEPTEQGAEKPIEPIAQADIPDWLKAMAPKEGMGLTNVEPEPAPENLPPVSENENFPDWLKDIGQQEGTEAVKPAFEPAPQNLPSESLNENFPEQKDNMALQEGMDSIKPEFEPAPWTPATESLNEGIPDLLKAVAPQEVVNSTKAEPELASQNPASESKYKEIPDSLKTMASQEGMDSRKAEPEPSLQNVSSGSMNEGIPEFLKTMASQEGLDTSKAEPEPTPQNVASESLNDDIPDFLKAEAPQEEVGSLKTEPEPAPQNVASESTDEEIPDWLKGITPQKGTDAEKDESEPAPLTPESMNEDLPDWLKSMAPQEAADVGKPESSPVLQPSAPESENEDLPDWLKTMAPLGEVNAATTAAEPAPQNFVPESLNEGLPDQLESVTPQGGADEVKAESEPAPQNLASVSKDEDLPDWLKAMAPQEGVEMEKPAIEPPSEYSPDVPENDTSLDWLPGLAAAALDAAPESSQPKTPPVSNVFPDWLTEEIEARKSADAGEVVASNELVSELPASEVNETPEAEESPVALQPAPTEEPAASAQPTPPIPSPLPPTKPLASAYHPDKEMPFQSSGEVKPLKIEDDAMAWLESLAVKQGAKEEELLTKPEDRSGEMPDSVRLTSEQLPEQPVEAPVSRAFEIPAQEQILPTSVETGMPPALKPDEGLSSVEAPIPFSPPADERPESINEEDVPYARMKDLKDEQDAVLEESPKTPAQQPIETPPDWLEHPVQEPEAPVEATAQIESNTPEASTHPAGNDITITSWLSKLDVEEALKKARSSPDAEQPPESSTPLPDWLKDLDKPTPPDEAARVSKAEADLPDWLRQPVQPAGKEGAVPLKPDNAPEPEMPSWVEETHPVSGAPTPTAPEEWVPVDVTPAQSLTPEPEQSAEQKPVPEPASSSKLVPPSVRPQIQFSRSTGTGMLSNIPVEDKDAELLMIAQSELDANKLNEAMETYLSLIKKGRLLDEVIHDLREALYRYPVDIIVWQTLGDASMRANRLQDALDAYTKAEELLR